MERERSPSRPVASITILHDAQHPWRFIENPVPRAAGVCMNIEEEEERSAEAKAKTKKVGMMHTPYSACGPSH